MVWRSVKEIAERWSHPLTRSPSKFRLEKMKKWPSVHPRVYPSNYPMILEFKLFFFSLRMDKFELIRYGLKKWKLITEGPTFQERKCEKSWTTDNCYACFATHICAKKVRTHIYILYRRFWLLSFDFFLECSDWGSNRNFWNKIHRAAQDRRKSFGEFYFFFFDKKLSSKIFL